MKTRPIDIILLVALVAVSGAIVWTLFSLGGGTASTPEGDAAPPPDSPPSVTLPGEEPGNGGEDDPGGDGEGGGVVPIAPGEDGAGGAGDGGEAASGASDASGDSAEVAADETEDAPDDGAEDGATTDADASPDAGEDEGAEAETDGDTEGDGADADEQEQAETDPLEPVPEGVVELQRVGFSYVTGGAGACEIVLEPWEHVAVSRELLQEYGCGAEVMVELADETGGRSQVQAVVADTMNPSFSRTVNVYVGEGEPALDYGLTTGNIAPME